MHTNPELALVFPVSSDISLMEQTISSLPTNQGRGSVEQSQIKTKSTGKQLGQEDFLLSLDTRLSEMGEVVDKGIMPAPESSQTQMFTSVTELTPEDPVTLLNRSAPCEAKLKPVISPCVHNLNEAMPFEDLSIFSSQPKESNLAYVDTSVLVSDQLGSHLETLNLEYPAQSHLLSEVLDGLRQNHLAPACQAEAREKEQETNKEVLHGQNVFFQKQSKLHPLPFISIQSPTLGVSQRSLIKAQEIASFRQFPLHQPQASCSTQNPHLQPFHLHSLLQCGTQTHLPNFLTSSHHLTGPQLHASQTPNIPCSNCTHFNTLHLPPKNLMQSDHHFLHRCQQPGLQNSFILQNPFIPNMRFNYPPPWSQLNLNSIQSTAVSSSNMTLSPSSEHMHSAFPFDTSGRELTTDIHEILQKVHENFRLWQTYCKIARTVYTSSPDLEALACFFL